MKSNKKIHPFTVLDRGVFWVVIDKRDGDVMAVRMSQSGAFESMVELIKARKCSTGVAEDLDKDVFEITEIPSGRIIDASIMKLFGFFARALMAGGMIYLIGYFTLKAFFTFVPA